MAAEYYYTSLVQFSVHKNMQTTCLMCYSLLPHSHTLHAVATASSPVLVLTQEVCFVMPNTLATAGNCEKVLLRFSLPVVGSCTPRLWDCLTPSSSVNTAVTNCYTENAWTLILCAWPHSQQERCMASQPTGVVHRGTTYMWAV